MSDSAQDGNHQKIKKMKYSPLGSSEKNLKSKLLGKNSLYTCQALGTGIML